MPGLNNMVRSLCTGLLVIMTSISADAQSLVEDSAAEQILVGWISHTEGEVLRHEPEEGVWIPVVQDFPFTLNDTLHAGEGARAEIIIPNNTWIRIGDVTRIQVIDLREDLTDVEIDSGMARFYNKGTYSAIRLRTPFGDVEAPPETRFDVYANIDSVEVICLRGGVYFTHGKTAQRVEVIEDSSSLVANNRGIRAGTGYEDPVWRAWNRDRDALWADKTKPGMKSLDNLPPALQDHAYDLEENGVWERVYYEGGTRYLWRPIYIGSTWAPFTVGRWTIRYGENTWFPLEPFGYVTHHYGNWIFTRGRWYWAPPSARIHGYVSASFFHIAFAWYPARVAWIHYGVDIGWIPLGPRERYYCHHRWGPRVVVIRNKRMNKGSAGVTRYRNYRHAVVVHQEDLYAAGNYRHHRTLTGNSARVASRYRVSPVLDRKIMERYRTAGRRHESWGSDRKLRPGLTGVRKKGRSTAQAPETHTSRSSRFTPVGRAVKPKRIGAKERFTPLKTGVKTTGISDVKREDKRIDNACQRRKIRVSSKDRAPIKTRKVLPRNMRQTPSKSPPPGSREDQKSRRKVLRSPPNNTPTASRLTHRPKRPGRVQERRQVQKKTSAAGRRRLKLEAKAGLSKRVPEPGLGRGVRSERMIQRRTTGKWKERVSKSGTGQKIKNQSTLTRRPSDRTLSLRDKKISGNREQRRKKRDLKRFKSPVHPERQRLFFPADKVF